jgi:hypothetical protein
MSSLSTCGLRLSVRRGGFIDRMGANRTLDQMIQTFWCRPLSALLGVSVLRVVLQALQCQNGYSLTSWMVAGELTVVGLFYLAAGLTGRWSLFWTALLVKNAIMLPGIPSDIYRTLVFAINPVILTAAVAYAASGRQLEAKASTTDDCSLLPMLKDEESQEFIHPSKSYELFDEHIPMGM